MRKKFIYKRLDSRLTLRGKSCNLFNNKSIAFKVKTYTNRIATWLKSCGMSLSLATICYCRKSYLKRPNGILDRLYKNLFQTINIRYSNLPPIFLSSRDADLY